MSRYDTNLKGTSPALSELLNKFAKMPRSSFDLTRRKSCDIYPYAITPIECGLMYPNTDITLQYDLSIITKNPTIRRMLSGMTAEISVYRMNCSDAWEGWNNFVTRGRSGRVSLEIPHLAWDLNSSSDVNTSLPYNPAHYLNIAPAVFFSNDGTNKWDFAKNVGLQAVSDLQSTGLTGISTQAALKASTALKVSALPFVMYAKVAKEMQNANLLQDNTNWYPVDENHDTILPYSASGQAVSCASYDYPQKAFVVGTSKEQPDNTTDSAPWLNVLYYKMKRGDYFNTGSPFPDLLRGDVPTINILSSLNFNPSFLNNKFNSDDAALPNLYLGGRRGFDVGVFTENSQPAPVIAQLAAVFDDVDDVMEFDYMTRMDSVQTSFGAGTKRGLVALANSFKAVTSFKDENISVPLTKNIVFSLNQWRKLAVETVLRERLARTDGSYNKMVQAMFGHNPNWHMHDVRYCGGSTQPIVFSEVVQTSADGATPLGTTSGRAVSAQNSNTIHVHTDDYSIYMAVLTLTPDLYYSQGVDRQFSSISQESMYLPLKNNEAPQATLNKELFVSGTNSTDEDVFNYQEYGSEYKSRQNQVSGLLSLPIAKVGDVGAFIFNHLFSGTPQFNQGFVQGEMSDNEQLCFASLSQAQFVATIISRCKMTGPFPMVAQPADMGLSY